MDIERSTASVPVGNPADSPTDQQRHELASRAGNARLASARAAVRYAATVRMVMDTQEPAVATREVLRRSIGQYAVLLRELDTSPERMLSLVKALIREGVASHLDEPETKSLLQHVVVWCVKAYYDTTRRA